MLKQHYPDFYFREVTYEELVQLPASSLSLPLVIKPAKGFRSVGVYLVEKEEDWPSICRQIQSDMIAAKEIYPDSVVSASSFILEEWIKGDEYAVDAYYDENGEPVVLNVYKRMFAHETDTSDRIYFTGKSVLKESLSKVEAFMRSMGQVISLRRFPMHFEIRVTDSGRLIPIEVNPLRFAGLCTTDLGAHAYGINVYEYFFEQKKPNWAEIIASLDDSYFSFLCAELPLSIDGRSIESVHDRRFVKNFSDILEYRLVSYEEYPTFSVVFYRSNSLEENKHLLELDLEQYLVMK
ncbi:ATP-grasp domain-containing protein [Brevibacillus sp. GCM10020057]|uniref:ATP-grasp domain-containing protein n=1 Tax=Brevibacillus sp. GCM10020057 TaxID=3317327 RepID=UPI00366F54F2